MVKRVVLAMAPLLRKAPFDFPPPVEARKDSSARVPFEMTLWRLSDRPRMNAWRPSQSIRWLRKRS